MKKLDNTIKRTIGNKSYWFAEFVCTNCGIREEKRSDTSHKNDWCKACNKKERLSVRYPKLYNLWTGMKNRCYTRSSERWESHGGRGIIVCDEWKHSSETFMRWALNNGYSETPSGQRNTRYTLDRVDNDGNYEPENCRITDTKVQGFNRQVLQRNNTTGYRGVNYSKSHGKFAAMVTTKKDGTLFCEYFDSSLIAALVREHYLEEHDLPHIRNFTEPQWAVLKELPLW